MNIKETFEYPYCEEYIVRYKILEDGFEVSKERTYYATVKGAHEKIHKIFKKKFPKAYLITITYQ